jgi:hypothetical protein|tara:strand:+ start:945 stop:1187 length:243 start_codon:yes stop_codon:yes gene_type:complete
MDWFTVALVLLQAVLLGWLVKELLKLRPESLLTAQRQARARAKARAARQQRKGSASASANKERGELKWRWLKCLGPLKMA